MSAGNALYTLCKHSYVLWYGHLNNIENELPVKYGYAATFQKDLHSTHLTQITEQ